MIFHFSRISSGPSESHSRSILDLDVSSAANPLELSSWGLPPEVLRRYNEFGITHMFEWQSACLRTGKVLTGGKLVHYTCDHFFSIYREVTRLQLILLSGREA